MLLLQVCVEELIVLSIFRNIITKEKIHNESTNPLMDMQIGHVGRRNRVTKVEIHQMRMKLDVGNFASGKLRGFFFSLTTPFGLLSENVSSQVLGKANAEYLVREKGYFHY